MPASPEPSLAAPALLLQALAARGLQVQHTPPAGKDAAAPRPILSASHLLLPQDMDWPVQRAAVAHAAAHLLYSPAGQTSATLKPMGLAVVAAVEDARVEQLLMQRLPGVRAWFLEGLRSSVQPHGLEFAALLSRMSLALLDERYADGNHWVDKARTLFAAARRQYGLEDYAAFRRIASVLANDLGQMRVRFNARQYAVPARYRDDNSYLWHHGAAPDAEADPVPLATPQAALAPGRDGTGGPTPLHAGATTHRYPEWDYRTGVLRQDWCTLIEQRPEQTAPAVVDTSTGRLLQLPPRRRPGHCRRLRRQWEGEEIDLNAAIEVQIERRLQLAPEGRLFQRPGPQRQPLSLLLLLDLSQSTGARAAGSAQTLLALEQQAALLLAHAALAAGDRIAIHGFSSDTRAQIHYHRLLEFGAALDAPAAARVRAAPARYSTRLGAALRHATSLLAAERNPLRALLVLSDGAPADVDVHDERYLVQDARAAVQAATQARLQVHGLLVDAAATAYARQIFGARQFRVIEQATQLPAALRRLHARIAMH